MNKHIFIDWTEVEPGYGASAPGFYPLNACPSGVTLKTHRPKVDPSPIIVSDRPWESCRVGVYGSFIKIGDTYYCWYESITMDYEISLCLATSKDTVHWEKPVLGVVDFHGSTENNIVVGDIKGVHGYTVLYREDAPENEKFQMIFTYTHTVLDAERDTALYYRSSPDGIHWSKSRRLVIGGDTQSSFLYDKINQKYYIYTKCQKLHFRIRRVMSVYEAKDINSFDVQRLVMYGNPLLAPDTDDYTTACTIWEGTTAQVMLPAMYHHTSDLADLQLALSRDTYTWNRPLTEPLVEAKDLHDMMQIYACIGMTPDDDGNWIHYVCTLPYGHNYSFFDNIGGAYHRLLFREDGYMSLHAEEKGNVWTVPMKLSEQSILVNAEIAEGGSLKVELTTDRYNVPVDGYTLADCHLTRVDKNHYLVTWDKQKPLDLSQKYYIHFAMEKTDIYSYSI